MTWVRVFWFLRGLFWCSIHVTHYTTSAEYLIVIYGGLKANASQGRGRPLRPEQVLVVRLCGSEEQRPALWAVAPLSGAAGNCSHHQKTLQTCAVPPASSPPPPAGTNANISDTVRGDICMLWLRNTVKPVRWVWCTLAAGRRTCWGAFSSAASGSFWLLCTRWKDTPSFLLMKAFFFLCGWRWTDAVLTFELYCS